MSKSRRRNLVFGSLVAAECRVAGGEKLERRLPFATLGAAAMIGSAMAGQTFGQAEIGALRYTSPAVNITDVRDAEYSNGNVIIVGNSAGVGVSQTYSVATAEMDAPVAFWSQHVAQNGGVGGISDSFLFGVSVLADGRIVHHGDSSNGTIAGNPTLWFDPTKPLTAARFASDVGAVNAVSPSGVTAGFLNFDGAAVGTISQPLGMLPGASTGNVFSVSSDDRYLVGNGIWAQSTPSALSYDLLDVSLWETPDDSLSLPSTFEGTARIGSTYFVAATYVTDEFSSKVAVWDIATGKLVGTTEAGDYFADFREIEGQMVLGVNGLNGGAVYLPNTEGLGARSDLSAKLGTADDTIVKFFGDELGVLFQVGGQVRAASLDFITAPPEATPTELQVSIRSIGLFGNDAYYYGNGFLEVRIQSTKDFDVSKVNWRSITISSTDGTGSATARIGVVRDLNRDRIKDVTLYFWMNDLRRENVVRAPRYGETLTTDFVFSGINRAGDEFFGTSSFTFDSLPWWQRRLRRLFGR